MSLKSLLTITLLVGLVSFSAAESQEEKKEDAPKLEIFDLEFKQKFPAPNEIFGVLSEDKLFHFIAFIDDREIEAMWFRQVLDMAIELVSEQKADLDLEEFDIARIKVNPDHIGKYKEQYNFEFMPVLAVVAGEWSGNIDFRVQDPAERSLEEQANDVFDQISFIAKRLLYTIECDQIKNSQVTTPFMYFIGDDEESLGMMIALAIFERMTFGDEVRFLVNNEPQCKKELEMEFENQFALRMPFIDQLLYENAEMFKNTDDLGYWITKNLVNGHNQFDFRAAFAMYELNINSIIYFRKGGQQDESILDDPIAMIIKDAINYEDSQHELNNNFFFTISDYYEQGENGEKVKVHEAYMIKEEDDLPALVVYLPQYQIQVRYVSESGDFSLLTDLERIILWGTTIQVRAEKMMADHYLKEENLSEDDREYFEDMKAGVAKREQKLMAIEKKLYGVKENNSQDQSAPTQIESEAGAGDVNPPPVNEEL